MLTAIKESAVLIRELLLGTMVYSVISGLGQLLIAGASMISMWIMYLLILVGLIYMGVLCIKYFFKKD